MSMSPEFLVTHTCRQDATGPTTDGSETKDGDHAGVAITDADRTAAREIIGYCLVSGLGVEDIARIIAVHRTLYFGR
jgi:hypothetical protein